MYLPRPPWATWNDYKLQLFLFMSCRVGQGSPDRNRNCRRCFPSCLYGLFRQGRGSLTISSCSRGTSTLTDLSKAIGSPSADCTETLTWQIGTKSNLDFGMKPEKPTMGLPSWCPCYETFLFMKHAKISPSLSGYIGQVRLHSMPGTYPKVDR